MRAVELGSGKYADAIASKGALTPFPAEKTPSPKVINNTLDDHDPARHSPTSSIGILVDFAIMKLPETSAKRPKRRSNRLMRKKVQRREMSSLLVTAGRNIKKTKLMLGVMESRRET